MVQTVLTVIWKKKFDKELEELKKNKLPSILLRLKEAIQQWDISENAEYETSMQEKEFTESRILKLENILRDVKVIKWSVASSEVKYGCVVVLEDDKKRKWQYTLVWTDEVDILTDTISFESPLWKAIKWKSVWDEVSIRAPKGRYSVKIISIH
jgi:transcription elongation factor GreA